MSPLQLNKWLVLFCDEINLPDMDRFGTPCIVLLLFGPTIYIVHNNNNNKSDSQNTQDHVSASDYSYAPCGLRGCKNGPAPKNKLTIHMAV